MKKFIVFIPELDYKMMHNDAEWAMRSLAQYMIIEAENADDAIYKRVMIDRDDHMSEDTIRDFKNAFAVEIVGKISQYTKLTELNNILANKEAEKQKNAELEQLAKLKAKYENK